MPSEYFQLLDCKDPTKRSLRVNRVVWIEANYYYTLDYYPDVKGQPLLLIVKKGDSSTGQPVFTNMLGTLINKHREVTNEPEYSHEAMAALDYEMPEEDRIRTQLSTSASKAMARPKSRTATIEVLD